MVAAAGRGGSIIFMASERNLICFSPVFTKFSIVCLRRINRQSVFFHRYATSKRNDNSMSALLLKLFDGLLKLIGPLAEFFAPSAAMSIQIRVRRLTVRNMNEVEEFIALYTRSFPEDGTNYTEAEILELLQDIKNEKKHVSADNIILTAHYKDTLAGFIVCHYYPEKKYGIISYLAKDKDCKDGEKYVGTKLIKRLNRILVKEHGAELVVFELQKNSKDKAKAKLFKLYANSIGLKALELDFPYNRPKLNLSDQEEESLVLMIAPISLTVEREVSKERVIDILSFIHFYCYGDIYDDGTIEFMRYHQYLSERILYYTHSLPSKVVAH
jgi:hypothetical protein